MPQALRTPRIFTLFVFGWIALALPSASPAVVTFTDIGAGLPGTYYGTNVWGDYDGDGDLDLLVSGDTYTGGGSPASTGTRGWLPRCRLHDDRRAACAGAWGDYDGDNDLDILLCGQDEAGTSRTWIYKNNSGGFGFTEVPNSLPGLAGELRPGSTTTTTEISTSSSVGWTRRTRRRTVLARNDGGDLFTIVSPGFPDLLASAACWGDYDRDGDLDLALFGSQLSGERRTGSTGTMGTASSRISMRACRRSHTGMPRGETMTATEIWISW